MARILVLTDRPQEDDALAARAVELAYQLSADRIAAVVSRSEDLLLPSGFVCGVSDGGLLPQEMSSLSIGWNDSAADRWFARCRLDSTFYGVTCETVRANSSFRRTAAKLANLFELVMVSRDTLVCDDGELVPLRTLLSEVDRPWLICPHEAPSWRRIVVASANDTEPDVLMAWGGHWSQRFDVPLAVIELRLPEPHSAWSAVTRWLPWSSPRQHREAVRDGLLACGLGSSDLLLVHREPAAWPFPAKTCEASLNDLMAAAPCAIGVAPSSMTSASQELLFPHEWLFANKWPDFEIVAA